MRGAFIVGISPVLKGLGLDSIFALFGGIGLVIVPLQLGRLAIAFGFNGLVSPMTEELYFCGFLLPRICRYGAWALVLNTLLFSLYHVWTPWRWPQIAVGFLPLALTAWRTRRKL
jgi:membrane protease YdiL (CAAX protease family)